MIAITRSHSVDVDLGAFGFLERREQCGIVDENVDLAETLHGFGDQRLHRAFIADIGDRALDGIGAMLAGERRGDLAAIGNIGNHQARALGGERACIVTADSFGAAGQDCHAAVETRHCSVSSRSLR